MSCSCNGRSTPPLSLPPTTPTISAITDNSVNGDGVYARGEEFIITVTGTNLATEQVKVTGLDNLVMPGTGKTLFADNGTSMTITGRVSRKINSGIYVIQLTNKDNKKIKSVTIHVAQRPWYGAVGMGGMKRVAGGGTSHDGGIVSLEAGREIDLSTHNDLTPNLRADLATSFRESDVTNPLTASANARLTLIPDRDKPFRFNLEPGIGVITGNGSRDSTIDASPDEIADAAAGSVSGTPGVGGSTSGGQVTTTYEDGTLHEELRLTAAYIPIRVGPQWLFKNGVSLSPEFQAGLVAGGDKKTRRQLTTFSFKPTVGIPLGPRQLTRLDLMPVVRFVPGTRDWMVGGQMEASFLLGRAKEE
ncbi:MAG: hypothetical protein QME05_01295 [Candidatus Margulisbacteria bacterium]|nr:hypothetical protein [Candidatus Margulisiibacteriota bacterium]